VRYSLYPKESDKIMLFLLLVLAVPTLFKIEREGKEKAPHTKILKNY
jgi:hypothetical protein